MGRGVRGRRRRGSRCRGDRVVDDGSDGGGDTGDGHRTPGVVIGPANRECGLQLGDLRQGLLFRLKKKQITQHRQSFDIPVIF